MEKLDRFQRCGYFFRKGGLEFRALQKLRSGVCVQGAEARPGLNVPRTAETEEHLIWEFKLCSEVSYG